MFYYFWHGEPASFFKAPAMNMVGLARHGIRFGEACNAFSGSETDSDGLYPLFAAEKASCRTYLSQALRSLARRMPSRSLSRALAYHLAFELGDRAGTVEIQAWLDWECCRVNGKKPLALQPLKNWGKSAIFAPSVHLSTDGAYCQMPSNSF